MLLVLAGEWGYSQIGINMKITHQASFKKKKLEVVFLTQILNDYAIWLLENQPFAVGDNLSKLKIDVEDSTQILLNNQSGKKQLPVSISLNYLQTPSKRYFNIVGDKGTIECDLIRNNLIINYLNNKKRKIIRLDQFDRNFMFVKEIGEFLKFIKNKKSQNVDIQRSIV